MASTTEISPECGAHFELQRRNGTDELDVFAVIGLHADGHYLDLTRLRSHIIKTVIPHVFERRGEGSEATEVATSGAKVPTWEQVNAARDIFRELTDSDLCRLQKKWRDKSEQTWNPFEAPGDPRALVPKPELKNKLDADYYDIWAVSPLSGVSSSSSSSSLSSSSSSSSSSSLPRQHVSPSGRSRSLQPPTTARDRAPRRGNSEPAPWSPGQPFSLPDNDVNDHDSQLSRPGNSVDRPGGSESGDESDGGILEHHYHVADHEDNELLHAAASSRLAAADDQRLGRFPK